MKSLVKRVATMAGGCCWFGFAFVFGRLLIQEMRANTGLDALDSTLSPVHSLLSLTHVICLMAAVGLCLAIGIGLCACGLVSRGTRKSGATPRA